MSTSNWKQIRDAYEHSSLSMKDVANKYHVKYGTLRVHKNRYKWQRKSHSNSSQSKSKHETLHRNSVTKPVTPKIDVKELQKSGLTPKRQNFCLLYLKYYNATKAYKLAYGVSYKTANANGYQLLVNHSIQKELTKLRQKQVDNLHIDKSNIIERLLMMFFADIGDYIHFGHKQRQDLDTGEKYQQSYVYLRNQEDVDTAPVAEIHIGQNGTEVKLPDKIQLAKELLKYLPDPINQDVHQDTLVSAFEKYIKNNSKNHDKSHNSDKK